VHLAGTFAALLGGLPWAHQEIIAPHNLVATSVNNAGGNCKKPYLLLKLLLMCEAWVYLYLTFPGPGYSQDGMSFPAPAFTRLQQRN
jgi:hypothetical protein